jgi:hypothetical protein
VKEIEKTSEGLGLLKRTSVLALSAALAISACTSDHPSKTEARHAARATTTEKSPVIDVHKSGLEYFGDENRNIQISTVVRAAGEKIVQAAQSNKMGYFDFYNEKADQWQSKSPHTTGWGWLQHNPQYGGSPNQAAVYVYRNPDGTFDIDKDIHALDINIVGQPSIDFESPNLSHLQDPAFSPSAGWEITIAPDAQHVQSARAAADVVKTVGAVKAIDNDALSRLGTYMQTLGLN